MPDKDTIKNLVLTENTAQNILNHLNELESNRARMQTRWIWELLQNARDTSVDDTSLVTSIEVNDREVIFQHNGRGFTKKEVAHLIYHGSTKLEDENTIGQYGSGFLTTHLLSPAIDVSGQLDDRMSFEFRIERKVSSAKALSDSMDQAWDDFNSSINSSAAITTNTFTTKFRYPIEEGATSAVRQGIETLRRCAPFVAVLNRQFRSININLPDSTTSLEVIDRISLPQEQLQIVTVSVKDYGTTRKQKYFIAEDEFVSVTIPIEQRNGRVECKELEDTPRLFLGFPLVGTERFSFPAVINSFGFTPTENRDGVYLGQSDNLANRKNQGIIDKACDLQIQMMKYAAKAKWNQVHILANIPKIYAQTWFDGGWLHERIGRFIETIRNTAMVRNGRVSMRPIDSVLPLATEDKRVKTLWDLISEIEALYPQLPERHEASGWCRALKSWESFLNRESSSLDEGYDGNSLAVYIEQLTSDSSDNCGTLQRLEESVLDNVDAVEWLDRFCSLLSNDGLDHVIQERKIVLDQAGFLDRLENLYRDTSMDDELKAIGDDILDLEIRERLRDRRLSSLDDAIGKGDIGNREVSQEIMDKLRELGSDSPLPREVVQASPLFLAWIVAKQQWSHLTRYPAYAVKPDDGAHMILWLDQRGSDKAKMPLAPVGAWNQDLQRYADLFPWQYIMANAFFDTMPSDDVWQVLSEEGCVRTDVKFSIDRSIDDFLPDEPLAEGEHGPVDHKTVGAVSITDLSFLTDVMGRVRDSQTRARLFWRFLTEWLIIHDLEGLRPRTAECECGRSHDYFPAMWLVPVVRNTWVPQGNDRRDKLSAQSLANLLQGSDWSPSSLDDSESSVRFLEAIRMTRFDLIRYLVVTDEESRSRLDDTMTEILISTDGDLSYVREFVEDMADDERLLSYLAERRERRRIVRENQHLGSLVEDLVREGLEKEGFTVRRTGIGSDFEISYDVIEDDEEIGIELSRDGKTWLVEVKATRERSVRMTAKQAETAVEEGDGFLLCVVSVRSDCTDLERDDVVASMKFVENIGSRLERLCVELDALNDLRDEATLSNESGIQLEIEAGAARMRVDDTVWQDGVHLQDLAAHLQGN